jgi:putative transposase
VELTGEHGLLPALVRQVLQTGLEVEMSEHLGYDRHAVTGRGSGNSRNGSYPKQVTTEIGPVDLRVPRDRNATFDPVTVPKGQRRLDGLTGNVVSLYAKGMTTGDIQAHWPRSTARTSRGTRSRGSPTLSWRTWWRGSTGPWTGLGV